MNPAAVSSGDLPGAPVTAPVVAAPLVQRDGMGADWAQRLDRHGDAVALLTGDGSVLSYRQLLAAADGFAARLAPAGSRVFVALFVRNDVPSITAYVGCLRAGHPVLLLDADGDADRIVAGFAPDVLAWPSEDRIEARAAAGDLHPDLALLLSTSGSTGSPKLVRLSAAAVAANAAQIVTYLGLTPAERAVTTLAIHYSFGLSILNSHLMAGASLLVTDLSVTHPDFATLLANHQPTSLSGVPYVFELLERTGLETRLPASITALTQAGGRLPPDRVAALAARGERQGFRFFAMYGQTEAAPRMAYLPPELAERFPDCIGIAIPGGEFSLIDDAGTVILAAETAGELVYRGPNVMMGYAFERADLGHGHDTGELRTGDIAVRNAAGLYRIVGRASRFAKIAGLRIGFDDIEAQLHAAGETAVVTGDDTLVSVHVEAAGDAAAQDRIAALVAAGAHIPESAVAVTGGAPVPRLASGKVDYAAVRRAGAAAAAGRAAAAAAGVHPILAGYRRAFNRPALTDAASFEGQGGDSLAYVNAAMTVEKALGQLPAKWETMPVAALIALAPDGALPAAGSAWSRIGTETLVRLAALALVIIGHADAADTGFLRGGATILFLMAGYNLARFQKGAFEAGRTWPAVAGTFERMILPYLLLMTALLFASSAEKSWGWFGLVSVFTVDDARRGPLFAYWFIESVFHALVITALLFQLAPVRRFSQARPFGFGLLLLGLGVAARLLVPALVFDDSNQVGLTVDANYYLYALGWLALVARGRAQQLAVYALAVALVGWDHGLFSSRQAWLAVLLAPLLLLPSVPVPRAVAGPLLRIAAASYFIYILHPVINHVLRFEFGFDDNPLNIPLLLGLSIAGGVVFEALWSRGMARMQRLRARDDGSRGAVVASICAAARARLGKAMSTTFTLDTATSRAHPVPEPVRRLTVPGIAKRKGGEPVVMLTAYTARMAQLLDRHCDMLLVGDSLGQVIYGLDTTVRVTLDMMIAHGAAVVRGSYRSVVVVDLPFGSYEASPGHAFESAARVMKETGAAAVKLEGGTAMAPTIAFLAQRGIPVVAHVGLTPQAVNALGGYGARGRSEAEAATILADAVAVAAAGAFAMVVEGVVEPLGRAITETVACPTIGIGASAACDGQVLVVDDMLGMFERVPRFVERFDDLAVRIDAAAASYAAAVRERRFPTEQQLYR